MFCATTHIAYGKGVYSLSYSLLDVLPVRDRNSHGNAVDEKTAAYDKLPTLTQVCRVHPD